MTGAQVPLGQLATLRINPGPPMIRSENAQRTAWVFVDIAGRDLGGYVAEAKRGRRRAGRRCRPATRSSGRGSSSISSRPTSGSPLVVPITWS